MSDDEWEELPESEPGSDGESEASFEESESEDESETEFDDESSGSEGAKKKKKKAPPKAKAAAAKASPKAAAGKASPKAKAAPKRKAEDDAEGSPAPKKAKAAPKKAAGAGTGGASAGAGGSGKKPAAPKKGAAAAVKTVSGAAAKQMVLDYLVNTNRPFAHTQLFDNLHKAVKKVEIPRILDQLAAEGTATCYTFNKVKLYVADQGKYPDVDQGQLDQMDLQIRDQRAAAADAKAALKRLAAECAALEAQPTDSEAVGRIAALEAEVAGKKERLGRLEGSVVLVSPAEIAAMHNKLKANFAHWRKRKAAVRDMVDQALGDESTQKPSQFMEELGIEPDDEGFFKKVLQLVTSTK